VNEANTHHHHSSATRAAGGDLSELLDLDAEMTRDYWNEVMDWIEASGPEEVRRIVDLGSGPGAGTISLAVRFDRAEVFAIDASDQMLDATSRRAAERGLADRITVIQADLDSTWPEIGRIDLTWASMSLHHLAHPEELIRRVYSATRPGGQIAIAEFIEPVRFLPDDLGFGVPGLEQRCVDAFRRERLRSLPNFGLQWGERLEQAGFSAVEERVFTLTGGGEDPSRLARYAWLWLERVASAAAPQLSDEDLGALEELLGDEGPHSLQRRHDLQMQGSRVVVRATK
jgi:SAM-dependent methyltransferase